VPTVITILRVIHVLAAVIWTGVAFYNVVFLSPAVKASGPAGGAVMQKITSGSLIRVMQIVPLVTVLAGFILYWYYSRLSMAYITSLYGLFLTVSALFGLAAFLEGAFVTGPTAAKVGELGAQMAKAGGPPPSEQLAQMQKLRDRLERASTRGLVFLILAVVGMTLGSGL
jgi:hypothetical protein